MAGDQVFYAEDPEGALRRWTPSRDMLQGNQMAAAIRGPVGGLGAASVIENLVYRLVKQYGADENEQYIQTANQIAKSLRSSLPENQK